MTKIMTLAKHSAILGELQAEGSIRLEGRFEGNGSIKGAIYIAAGASWEGNLIAELVIVRGILHGDVAAERIILLEGAVATGSLVSSKIHIQLGATFSGAMRMRKTPRESTGTATVHQLPSNLRQIAGT